MHAESSGQVPWPPRGARVVVAMSGGVDSAVAAAMLVERGCDVVGITLSLLPPDQATGGCCTVDDAVDARRVAAALGVPHYVLNERAAFEAAVIAPFVDAWRRGETPNPCIACNDVLKFDRLLSFGRELGADWLATGHHARLRRQDGRTRLLRAADPGKDQSYFLAGMPEGAIDRLCLPVGEQDKAAVRARAEALGLRVASKPDSQDACFLPRAGVPAFLASRGVTDGEGDIVDETGAVIGRHRGALGFTPGQRRGLGVASSEPLYVLRVEPARRRLVVAPGDALGQTTIPVRGLRWLRPPGPDEAIGLQVRSRGQLAPVLRWRGDPATFELGTPQRAPAPGQQAVVYAGDEVIGVGTIGPIDPAGAGVLP